MAATRYQSELRKPAGSPRPRGRENAKDTLCRNVLIYGHCRYEDQGCAFNHDPNKTLSAQPESIKKSLNVDSPSFTPATLPVPGKTAITSHAAAAAPFTPRGLASGTVTPSPQPEPEAATFNPAQIREFTPSNYDLSQAVSSNGTTPDPASYDPFSMAAVAQAMPTTQFNPYLDDTSNIANNGSAYYQTQPTYTAPAQPLQYHLYAPIGPHREDLLAYQRLTHDFFMPEKLREDLQKKSEATLQVMPNSQLPNLDNFHTLVALDTSHHKSATVFGFPGWVYKATSSKNGKMYCLRRLEGYRLTNEHAIRSVKDWRRVDNANVVSVIDAFTTRAFGDSSLIFVTDYFPLSKTLVEHHFTSTNRYGARMSSTVPEKVLWGYIVQIASAIKSVHSANLAVRCLDPSKVILTDKSRIRLNACAILDVVQYDAQKPLAELQQEDFILFGRLILSIATNNLSPNMNLATSLDQLGRTYTAELRETLTWLLTKAPTPDIKNINDFISGISTHVMSAFDSSLHAMDTQTSELSRELENGRLVRLLSKLGTINERPEYDGDRQWSENGERYMLKLFRDYTFHQVDAEGRPVVDLGHIIRSLNKLDAGIEEKISLTSRDDQTTFVVSYRELKKQVNAAFADLQKSPNKTRY